MIVKTTNMTYSVEKKFYIYLNGRAEFAIQGKGYIKKKIFLPSIVFLNWVYGICGKGVAHHLVLLT